MLKRGVKACQENTKEDKASQTQPSSALTRQPRAKALGDLRLRSRKVLLEGYKFLKVVLRIPRSEAKETAKQHRLRFYLGALPPDAILEVLAYISSFKDLYSFITSSRLSYGLFNAYPIVILTQVAKNILGDAWEEAIAVLVWQRNTVGTIPDYAAVVKDLEAKFIFRKSDIRQLVANQRYFNSCATVFLRFAALNRCRFHAAPGSNCNTYFSTGGAFPIKTFYSMWLLYLRFRYESIETFATHKALTAELHLDHYVMSKVMLHNKHFREFIFTSGSWDTWDNVLSRNLFGIWVSPPSSLLIYRRLPVLRHKMLCHLVSSVVGSTTLPGLNPNWMEELGPAFTRFTAEYGVRSLSDLIKDYGLDN